MEQPALVVGQSGSSGADRVRLNNPVQLERKLKASDALFDSLAFSGEAARLSEFLKRRSVHWHEPLVPCVTGSPGALPFARQRVSRPRYYSNWQVVVKQITVPILANRADQPILDSEHLKHQHGVADINPEIALVFKVSGALGVVSQYPARRRHLYSKNVRQP